MTDSAAPLPRFETVEDYLAWSETRGDRRHELVGGEVVAMAPERVLHSLTKGLAWRALDAAVRGAGVPCMALPDGVGVRAEGPSAFEPDVTVNCGPLDPKGVFAPDPVILVEVISPSSRSVDTGVKLSAYFTIPSVMHYLILDADGRRVIHHARDGARILTAIRGDGVLRLDPPGIEVEVEALFPPPDAFDA